MKDLVKDVKNAAIALDQSSLFGDPKKDLESACKKFLKYNGYIVVKPEKFKERKVKSTRDLVELFYALLDRQIGGDKFFEGYRNSAAHDMAIAKRFVASRMEVNGVGEEPAINECANIIKTIFEHYNDFKFKYDISFSIFGQQKLAWVTERAIQILNQSLRAEVEDRSEAARQAALDAQDKAALVGYKDLDELVAQIKKEEEEHG